MSTPQMLMAPPDEKAAVLVGWSHRADLLPWGHTLILRLPGEDGHRERWLAQNGKTNKYIILIFDGDRTYRHWSWGQMPGESLDATTVELLRASLEVENPRIKKTKIRKRGVPNGRRKAAAPVV